MALTPGTRLGPYEVTAQIGVGGMGEVYKATDTNLRRAVAIKALPASVAADADRLARFQREAEVLASLNHPHIAQIHGLEKSDGITALVMELVEGPTLDEWIRRPEGLRLPADGGSGRPSGLPIDEALRIAHQIAEALEAAHEQGIIHRDLKPANIKVRADGTVKVLDFGLAKAMDPASALRASAGHALSMSPTITSPAMMTGVGVILGTAAYMSPEQARGKTVDKRADIWAFGCVLYEMLTGKRPFDGEDMTEVLGAVVRLDPNWDALPREVAQPVRTLLQSCLVKDPRHRVADISTALFVLDKAASLAPRPTAPSVTPRRTILPWVIAAIALLIAGVSLTRVRTISPQPPVVRFQLPFFNKAPGLDVEFELSPDGRYLAFAASVDGPRQLWVRALDSTDVRAVVGTEGATYPMWSPDSASLAFFANGKLKKIAASGGAAQVLCDAPDGRGGTWGADGDIVFAPAVTGPLFRVPSSGGAPVALTKSGASEQRQNDRYPSFIVGTRQFLFLHQASSADASGIYIGSLDGAPATRLLPEQTNAYYTADAASGKGWLIFRRESSVMAQAFDPATTRLSGEAVQLAASVGDSGNTGKGAFAASANGSLAAWPTAGALGQLVWVDRSGRRLSAVTKPSQVGDFQLSPDEKRLVMWSGGLRPDFWLQDLERSAPARFTFGEHADGRAVWSPDGRTIAYAERPTSVASRLYRKSADSSSKEELLIESNFQMLVQDWSRDGKYVVYQTQGAATQGDLLLFPIGDTDGAPRRPIVYQNSPATEDNGAFSPDSHWMAYTSDESSEPRVYVQAVPASGPKWQVSARGGDLASWPRDGRELYYISSDRKLMAVPVEVDQGGFRAGTPQQLFDVPAQTDYQPSADGRRFLVKLAPEGTPAVSPLEVILNWPSSVGVNGERTSTR